MKFLNIRGATAVAILPPPSLKRAAWLVVWSSAGSNARRYRVESKFYRCLTMRSNPVPVSLSALPRRNPQRQPRAQMDYESGGASAKLDRKRYARDFPELKLV